MTYGIAALAYAALALLLIASWRKSGGGTGLWLIGATLAAMTWAVINATAIYVPMVGGVLGAFGETLRSAGWILFLAALMRLHWRGYGRPEYEQATWVIVGAGLIVLVTLDVLLALQNLRYIAANPMVPQVVLLGRMATAVAAVFLVDNLYRNTAATDRWGIKLLCLGLGAIFLFDFFFYADAVLSSAFSFTVYEARGIVNALIVPLIAVSAARNPAWKLNVFVSRGVAIHTASLIGSGVYLVVMGAAGYYLRDLGGRWGTLLQFSFWFGAILLLVVIVFSGQFRARMRVLVNKHFFNYRYDYRDEWLRFISTVSISDMARDLQERVIQAVADIVDSPGGALWQVDDSGQFVRVALWNNQGLARGSLGPDDPFIRFLRNRAWIIDFEEYPVRPDLYEGCEIPDWMMADSRLWLVVPLMHYSDDLVGFIILERPRAPREFNWEDRDILKTVGRQVASYLAEQNAEKALSEARQFDEFNKRFAFIIHDIKNLASQLSLMVRNADRHAGNPEFQKDMILTVRDSVDKMQGLLARLNRLQETETKSAFEPVDLPALLAGVVERPHQPNVTLTFSCERQDIVVKADPAQLETVFSHLTQNALDAVGEQGRVDVKVAVQDRWAVVSVSDTGPGMDEAFIRDGLFRPFRTTKDSGYGIGAYESRQLIRNSGGRLDVASTPGEGTVMTVRLSLLQGEERAPPALAGAVTSA